MNLGKIIYTKRKEKGLSQEQLANQINVARQTICK
ncbi:helix-turn-helix domain-containing protein [uncultured Thomasclavelia sp.]|nr:helix-turn-helix transcriptional regulator [uncultured Thomasclavelia sp.]